MGCLATLSCDPRHGRMSGGPERMPPMPTPPTTEEVLDALDPEQREVALALDGPVCVLAGAGTGKTRAITHRIAYGVLSGKLKTQHVLPVTFSNRAAREMGGRLRDLGVGGVRARTFHAAALAQLRYFWPKVVGGEMPRIEASKAPQVGAALSRHRVSSDVALVRDVAAEIEWAKVSQIAPDDYQRRVAAIGRTPSPGLTVAEVARVYASYEEIKRERRLIDFEDCLLLMVGMLEERPDVTVQVRDQYRNFVVDEYQDVSPLQQRLLDLWLGDRSSICVVGDAAQTIYSFAGATPQFLLGFTQRFPDATVARLVRDYRSTPQVVALANGVVRRSTGSTSAAALTLVAQQPPGPEPTFKACPDEPAEGAAVAAKVASLLAEGLRASEIAVLFRINAQSETYEQALSEIGVPYVLRGGERFFERPEVRQAVILMRGAARAAQGSPLDVDDVKAVLASAGWSAAPPSGSGAARDRWESLSALVGLAEDQAAARPKATLAELVTELEERAAAQHAPTVEGVTLATLHAAKGLEWDAVLLAGLVEGTLPLVHATTPEEIEEERRLLYVGITRARRHLHLSWATARTPGAQATRRPSRFLDGLRPADTANAAGARSERRGGRAAKGAPKVVRC